MILRRCLFEGVLQWISAFLLVPFSSMGGALLGVLLVCLGVVLWHGPIWYVLVVIGIFLCWRPFHVTDTPWVFSLFPMFTVAWGEWWLVRWSTLFLVWCGERFCFMGWSLLSEHLVLIGWWAAGRGQSIPSSSQYWAVLLWTRGTLG
jgi:hypothetical protein